MCWGEKDLCVQDVNKKMNQDKECIIEKMRNGSFSGDVWKPFKMNANARMHLPIIRYMSL